MDPLTPPAAAQDNTVTAAVPSPWSDPQPVPDSAESAEYPSLLAPDDPSASTTTEAPTEAAAEAEDFEITLPEGMIADPDLMGAVKDQIKSGMLKPEAAQQLSDQYVQSMKRLEATRIAEGMKQIDAWQNEIQNHQEFGGAYLDTNIEAAKNMLHRYGSPRLMQEFKQMGVLSHPEFAFMLMRMSKDVSDGRSLGGAPTATPETSAASIYPTMRLGGGPSAR